jgi:hypothetical protein
MKPVPVTASIRSACYHEAGHAVMQLIAGGSVDRIEIYASSKGEVRSSKTFLPKNAQAIVAMAGAVAERRAGFPSAQPSATDILFARAAMRHSAPGTAVRSADMFEMEKEADRLLARHWKAVRSIADSLAHQAAKGPLLRMKGELVEVIVNYRSRSGRETSHACGSARAV